MQKPSIPMEEEALRPQAKTTDLVVRELPGEELVYDLKTQQAHCLNKTAAAVWKQCDGQRSVTEIAALLQQEFDVTVNDQTVKAALFQLSNANLLEPRMDFSIEKHNQLRREILRRIGLGVAAALPLVTSIIAPSSAQAASCVATGSTGNCTVAGGNNCCSTCCNNTSNICLQTGLGNGTSCQRDCQCLSNNCPVATPRVCV